MGDEIKPVTPAAGIQPELPIRVPDRARLKHRHTPVPATAPEPNDGYDLSGITPQQAQQLISHPLMSDADALANSRFSELKDAISRRAQGAPVEQGDISTLITASHRVSGLVSITYQPGKHGEPMAPASSGELLALVDEFDRLAASFGQERPIVRG